MIFLKRLHRILDKPVLLARYISLRNGPHPVFCYVIELSARQLKDTADHKTQWGLTHKTQCDSGFLRASLSSREANQGDPTCPLLEN